MHIHHWMSCVCVCICWLSCYCNHTLYNVMFTELTFDISLPPVHVPVHSHTCTQHTNIGPLLPYDTGRSPTAGLPQAGPPPLLLLPQIPDTSGWPAFWPTGPGAGKNSSSFNLIYFSFFSQLDHLPFLQCDERISCIHSIPSRGIICGHYNGLTFFNLKGQKKFIQITGESVRTIQDDGDNLVVGTSQSYLHLLKFSTEENLQWVRRK